MCLDLRPGGGNLLGSYWEYDPPWLGAPWTLNTGASPRDAAASSLSQILEASPHPRYYLSRRACLGILRRAAERGKALPPSLEGALMRQAGMGSPMEDAIPVQPRVFHINQREETIDLGDVSGALMATQNMQMQTFIAAGFSAGAGASAGSIGYSMEFAPTLKGSPSGSMMPSVLCLNDQGGRAMDCSRGVSGTLRAQEHGHQPVVFHRPELFENHGIDARYTGPHSVSPTMSARYDTGGNNIPLVGQEPVFCITGNAIDRQPQNGGNGIGYQEDVAYTLTATDHHAVFRFQREERFQPDDVTSTQSARQGKAATDLVQQPGRRLIRRLTPLECERLQGFPDGWTDIPGASDSARYRALGNSVAIPCVTYILRGIVMAAG